MLEVEAEMGGGRCVGRLPRGYYCAVYEIRANRNLYRTIKIQRYRTLAIEESGFSLLILSSNFPIRGPCIVIYSYHKTNEMH